MLTQDYLKSILDYNVDTGIFTWKISNNRKIKIGDIAGTIRPDKYIQIRINGKTYLGHRLSWLYVYGKFTEQTIDHINNNPSDNRICNLREASVQENMYNRKINKSNKSGIKGICWHKCTNKWRARLTVNGKEKHIGLFDNLELAELAIIETRNKYHKEFANHGK